MSVRCRFSKSRCVMATWVILTSFHCLSAQVCTCAWGSDGESNFVCVRVCVCECVSGTYLQWWSKMWGKVTLSQLSCLFSTNKKRHIHFLFLFIEKQNYERIIFKSKRIKTLCRTHLLLRCWAWNKCVQEYIPSSLFQMKCFWKFEACFAVSAGSLKMIWWFLLKDLCGKKLPGSGLANTRRIQWNLSGAHLMVEGDKEGKEWKSVCSRTWF